MLTLAGIWVTTNEILLAIVQPLRVAVAVRRCVPALSELNSTVEALLNCGCAIPFNDQIIVEAFEVAFTVYF